MESVAGIFNSRRDAEQAFSELKEKPNFDGERLLLLTPDTSQDKIADVPTDEGEQPGMGATIGGVVGGAMGLATGAALSNLVLPGIGPILTLGLSATGGLGGAVLGATGGSATERALSNGLPKDEMFLYEDALRCGRSVVIANAESENGADAARAIMEHNHAESVDAARERWWIGIRDREADRYCGATPEDTVERERLFRAGFEAALQPDMRNKPLNKAEKRLREQHPDICNDEIFRRGYERGRRHLRTFQKNDASGVAKRKS
ncbi:MAG TPA: hypothetical protein VEG60_05135 [Candidatus Binatia bacterium]|nr:hypothetical protein [Candidatus Binatia bacterium]